MPLKRFNAINVLGMLFARKDAELDERLINHERIHTRQMLEMLVVGFYLWYVVEWLFRLPMKGNAYRSISFEREAYDNEGNLNYLQQRKAFAWLRYLRHSHLAIHLLAFVFVLLAGCQDQATSLSTSSEIVSPQVQEQPENGSLKETGVNDPAPQVAVLQDARLAYRLSNIRPQRLLPSSSNSGSRIFSRTAISYLSKFIINLYYDGRRREETSPFRTFVSSDYYIIALRRIVR